MSAADVPTPPEQDENRNDGCGPHCGHHADMVELTTLRKSYAAVLDQKRALLREIEALRAEIAYLQAAAR